VSQAPAGQGTTAPTGGGSGATDEPRFSYGGQALMEGIYMRGRDAIGVAVRGPDGQIFAGQEKLDSVLHRRRFARAPFFRGVVVLYETLVIGTRWLMKSGSLAAAGEGVSFGGKAIALTMLFTIGLAVGLFVLMPLLVATGGVSLIFGSVEGAVANFVLHVFEGLIRIAIFIGYLWLVSRSAEIGRVFQYHGAEHMTIHALEADLPLTTENIRKFPTAHPRCGTEFLVIFIIVSILLFSLLAGVELWVAILGRILLVPVIAAVSYEVLRFGAKRRESGFWRWLFLPGIWVQKITTKQPDDSMIEIAICSMQEALAANNDTAPAGSLDPAREPIPDADELAKEMEARFEAEEAAEKAQSEATTDDGDEAVEPPVEAPPADTAEAPDVPPSSPPAGEPDAAPSARATRPGGAVEGA
jgi:uncharacterized protein YqhQ